MSKDQSQQPPKPVGTNPGPTAPVAPAAAPAGDDFWSQYDRIAQQTGTGNSPYAAAPAPTAPQASPTAQGQTMPMQTAPQAAGGLSMGRQMDTGGSMLPPGSIQGQTMPMQQPGGVTGGSSTNTPYGPTVNSIPTGNVPPLVGGDALGTAMQDAQGAAYKNATGYLDPQWKNSQDTLESKLANQGVMQNSEAWNKGMDDFGRQKEFAYSQARSGAVQQGNAAQSQLFNQGLAANANQFGQNLEGGKFSNAVQQQLAAQGFTQQQIDNLEQQHRFDNSMSMRNQDINELLLQQQNPLNMMNALNSGGQVQQPQFTNTPGSNMNPTDILAAIQQQYGGQLNAYNAQTGSANSANSGMAGIIAALLCDRRLKKNIRKIGMHVVGVPLYEFDYLWGEHAVGVMADELEKVKPEAVHTLACGYRFVDYARL